MMVKFNAPQWRDLSENFEKNTDNGAQCPKCCNRAVSVRTKSKKEYGGTLVTHELKCSCGQYWYCTSYVGSD